MAVLSTQSPQRFAILLPVAHIETGVENQFKERNVQRNIRILELKSRLKMKERELAAAYEDATGNDDSILGLAVQLSTVLLAAYGQAHNYVSPDLVTSSPAALLPRESVSEESRSLSGLCPRRSQPNPAVSRAKTRKA
jgi:hypothetical protein